MQEEHAGWIASQPGDAARRNVLVVENDNAMRRLLRLHLKSAGYAVTLAEDATVAGRKLLKSPPDLIIADINLPYMSGLEFAAILMADPSVPHVPIILVSAHEKFAARAEALGADFILKPFSKAQLLETVVRSLQGRDRQKSGVAAPSAFASEASSIGRSPPSS